MTTKLSLYHLPYCGYCKKVRIAAAQLGIELKLLDISEDQAARELLLDTFGRTTVPVLRIENADKLHLLPESKDIIQYLKSEQSQIQAA